MTRLRQYQIDQRNAVCEKWRKGARTVMLQSPTGSGKTVVMDSIAQDLPEPGCAMAHRLELIGQLSCKMAENGLAHDIIAPKKLIQNVVRDHMQRFGRTTYNPHANWAIASVDTINTRQDIEGWRRRVKNVFIDEGHHVLRHNKWGKAVSQFPYLERMLLVSATPERPDGYGLGSWADGFADVLIEGPSPRWLIDQGYLCDYELYAVPASDLDLSEVEVAANGEFNQEQVAEAVKRSKTIVGDIVDTYIKYAKGLVGITFAVDIEHAHDIANKYNSMGIAAEAISSKSSDTARMAAIRKLERGEILQLVNVDLFGEGTDIPAIQCISFGRPTESFIVYTQQFGRVLRLLIDSGLMMQWDDFTVEQRRMLIGMSRKPRAKIFDHVSNVYRHEGPPDKPRHYSLDGTKSRGNNDAIPLRKCLECFHSYERFRSACPACGNKPVAEPRSNTIANVAGNIELLTDEVLQAMRKEVTRIDGQPVIPYGKPELTNTVTRKHQERQREQHYLRTAMGLWAATYHNLTNEENYKLFYYTFKTDVLSAMAYGAPDAQKLRAAIEADMNKRGYQLRY